MNDPLSMVVSAAEVFFAGVDPVRLAGQWWTLEVGLPYDPTHRFWQGRWIVTGSRSTTMPAPSFVGVS